MQEKEERPVPWRSSSPKDWPGWCGNCQEALFGLFVGSVADDSVIRILKASKVNACAEAERNRLHKKFNPSLCENHCQHQNFNIKRSVFS
jgi:hypothetical protein